jgi:hypothetical protein
MKKLLLFLFVIYFSIVYGQSQKKIYPKTPIFKIDSYIGLDQFGFHFITNEVLQKNKDSET